MIHCQRRARYYAWFRVKQNTLTDEFSQKESQSKEAGQKYRVKFVRLLSSMAVNNAVQPQHKIWITLLVLKSNAFYQSKAPVHDGQMSPFSFTFGVQIYLAVTCEWWLGTGFHTCNILNFPVLNPGRWD